MAQFEKRQIILIYKYSRFVGWFNMLHADNAVYYE